MNFINLNANSRSLSSENRRPFVFGKEFLFRTFRDSNWKLEKNVQKVDLNSN